MKKYEYLETYFYKDESMIPFGEVFMSVQDNLDELGSNGWQVINMTTHMSIFKPTIDIVGYHVILMREVKL